MNIEELTAMTDALHEINKMIEQGFPPDTLINLPPNLLDKIEQFNSTGLELALELGMEIIKMKEEGDS